MIHSPNYFLNNIATDNELSTILKYCKTTPFAESSLGKITLMISYVLEGPVVVILAIVMNVVSLISFRRFSKRKAELQAHHAQTTRRTENEERNDTTNKKLLKMTVCLSSFSVVIHLLQIAAQFILYVYRLSTSVGAWFLFSYVFICALKNLSNIFFFYNYNTQFKNAFLCCQTPTNQDQNQQQTNN